MNKQFLMNSKIMEDNYKEGERLYKIAFEDNQKIYKNTNENKRISDSLMYDFRPEEYVYNMNFTIKCDDWLYNIERTSKMCRKPLADYLNHMIKSFKNMKVLIVLKKTNNITEYLKIPVDMVSDVPFKIRSDEIDNYREAQRLFILIDKNDNELELIRYEPYFLLLNNMDFTDFIKKAGYKKAAIEYMVFMHKKFEKIRPFVYFIEDGTELDEEWLILKAGI